MVWAIQLSAPRHSAWVSFVGLLLVVFSPIVLGLLLFLETADLERRRNSRDGEIIIPDTSLFKVASLLSVCAFFGSIYTLYVASGRNVYFLAAIVAIGMGLLIYAIIVQLRSPSEKKRTLRWWQRVFVLISRTVFYIAFELIWVILSGGVGGSRARSGGGGSSGGGGASGKW